MHYSKIVDMTNHLISLVSHELSQKIKLLSHGLNNGYQAIPHLHHVQTLHLTCRDENTYRRRNEYKLVNNANGDN